MGLAPGRPASGPLPCVWPAPCGVSMVSSPLGAPGWDFPSGWKPDPQARAGGNAFPKCGETKEREAASLGFQPERPAPAEPQSLGTPRGLGQAARHPPLRGDQGPREAAATHRGWPRGRPPAPCVSGLEFVRVVPALAESGVSRLVSGSAGFAPRSLFLGHRAGHSAPSPPQADIPTGIFSPNPQSITRDVTSVSRAQNTSLREARGLAQCHTAGVRPRHLAAQVPNPVPTSPAAVRAHRQVVTGSFNFQSGARSPQIGQFQFAEVVAVGVAA